jgi:hypothetical protein
MEKREITHYYQIKRYLGRNNKHILMCYIKYILEVEFLFIEKN